MIYEKFRKRDLFLVFNMENSYRIQIIVELLCQSVPQIFIQAYNNYRTNRNESWDFLSLLSLTISGCQIFKNILIIGVFLVKRFIFKDQEAEMRPASYGMLQRFPRVDQKSLDAMMRYLKDPDTDKP